MTACDAGGLMGFLACCGDLHQTRAGVRDVRVDVLRGMADRTNQFNAS